MFSVTVSKMPEVAVISSGSELVEPSEVPGISQIRNSNSSQLLAQVAMAGRNRKLLWYCTDNVDQTYLIINKANFRK